MSNQSFDNASAVLDEIPKTYTQAVRVLAAAHSAGADRVDIYSINDPLQQVVRLIEVSDAFPDGSVERPAPPNGMERIVPVFPMGKAKDFPFRSEIVQVKPAEWDQLCKGTLKLNRDWGDLKSAKRIEHGE
jgi:hypothetical protein